MTDRDPVPATTVEDRKTRELCGAERDGLRCMRPKGHEHEHEAFNASRATTWK